MSLGAAKKKCCWWANYHSLASSPGVVELNKITPIKGIRSFLPLIHPVSHLAQGWPRSLRLGSLPLTLCLLALTLAALMLALLTLLYLSLAVLFLPLLGQVGLNTGKSAMSSLATAGPSIYPLSPSSSLTSSPYLG